MQFPLPLLARYENSTSTDDEMNNTKERCVESLRLQVGYQCLMLVAMHFKHKHRIPEAQPVSNM